MMGQSYHKVCNQLRKKTTPHETPRKRSLTLLRNMCLAFHHHQRCVSAFGHFSSAPSKWGTARSRTGAGFRSISFGCRVWLRLGRFLALKRLSPPSHGTGTPKKNTTKKCHPGGKNCHLEQEMTTETWCNHDACSRKCDEIEAFEGEPNLAVSSGTVTSPCDLLQNSSKPWHVAGSTWLRFWSFSLLFGKAPVVHLCGYRDKTGTTTGPTKHIEIRSATPTL